MHLAPPIPILRIFDEAKAAFGNRLIFSELAPAL
jgi:hypothetical protein